MLNIPDDFFKEEERLSFVIPEKMKRAWAVQLTVLQNVMEVADRHGIQLWLAYGSLLGAVRHGGYIPWDDDIDVCVFRKDYLNLLQFLQAELPEYMMVYSLYTWDDYTQPKAFIANRRNVDTGDSPEEAELTELYYGCPYGTGIDLYPLDYAPEKDEEWENIRQLYIAVYDLAMSYDTYAQKGELEGYLRQIEEIFGVSLNRDEHLKTSLWKLADRVAMMTTREEAGYALWYPDTAMRKTEMRIPLSVYSETLSVYFEFLKAPVPAGYKELLPLYYGEDYMTPIRRQAAHGYPFYAEQDEKMRDFKADCLNDISFPNAFFEDEVREGFFVMSMVKRYWAAQIKVLSEIDRICRKHDIKWFADYGTLIGAVRHKGFIPWDDDMDISMMRKDYEKFFAAAREELPKGYKILNVHDEPEYGEMIGRIINSEVIDYNNAHLAQYYGCPYTVGVDIFPIDSVYDNEEQENDRKNRAQKVASAIGYVDKGEVKAAECQKLLREIERENHIILHRHNNLHQQLMILLDKIYAECASEDTRNVAIMTFFVSYGNHRFKRALFANRVRLEFENLFLWAPARYEEILSIEYGDFLNVNKAGGMHDYPVYIDQERTLREKIQRNPYRYTLNYNELLVSVARYTQKIVDGSANANVEDSCSKGEEIVFLPCRAKWWKTMEPMWKKASENPLNKVYVLPLFYYDCNYNGEIGEKHDDRALFPDYVSTGDCAKYDFETRHPDKIVIQVPYDDWSGVMTVHEFFYSRNLLKYTDELIYIPCFDADAPVDDKDKECVALASLVEQPAVVSADKIVLKSDEMKRFYVETLVKLAGEETRNYWQGKIVVDCFGCEGLTEDKISSDCDEWNRLIGDHVGKKIIIYYVTISFLLKGGVKAIDKIKRSLEVFEANGDKACAVMIPQKQIITELPAIRPVLWQRYKDISDKIRSSGNIILDEDGLALKYMDKWNAYYGDSDFVARQCVLRGIPVMIENMDV